MRFSVVELNYHAFEIEDSKTGEVFDRIDLLKWKHGRFDSKARLEQNCLILNELLGNTE